MEPVDLIYVNGNPFPSYNGEALSWSLELIPTDERNGYPRLRTIIRAMIQERPRELAKEKAECLKGYGDRIFGHLSIKLLKIIEEEERMVNPNLLDSEKCELDGRKQSHAAEGWLYNADGTKLSRMCAKCAQLILDEYQEKLGADERKAMRMDGWYFERYDEEKRKDTDSSSERYTMRATKDMITNLPSLPRYMTSPKWTDGMRERAAKEYRKMLEEQGEQKFWEDFDDNKKEVHRIVETLPDTFDADGAAMRRDVRRKARKMGGDMDKWKEKVASGEMREFDNETMRYLGRCMDSLSEEWKGLDELDGAMDGDENPDLVHEYQTLCYIGLAEEKVEELRTRSGRVYGSRFYYRLAMKQEDESTGRVMVWVDEHGGIYCSRECCQWESSARKMRWEGGQVECDICGKEIAK